MSDFYGGGVFLFIWIGFLALMTGVLTGAILWGVRSGQFANQERARHLPLNSGIPHGRERKAGVKRK